MNTIFFEKIETGDVFLQLVIIDTEGESLFKTLTDAGIRFRRVDREDASNAFLNMSAGIFDELKQLAVSDQNSDTLCLQRNTNRKESFNVSVDAFISFLKTKSQSPRRPAQPTRAASSQKPTPKPETIKDRRAAGDRLHELAVAIQKAERVSYAEAWERVRRDNPTLFEVYRPQPDPAALSRKDAGDKLDAAAKQIQADKGIDYGAAFDRAKMENPKLTEAYQG